MRISDWSSDVCSSDLIDNMVKVQEMLGDRLGDDVHMYTVTTKPEVDTAESLKQYAATKGARWKFLSGDPASIRKILTAFNVMGSIHGLTDRKSVELGKSVSVRVDLGGRRLIKKKTKTNK